MKRALTIIGIVLLVILIWLSGPYIGFEAPVDRLYVIMGLLLIVAIITAIRVLKASRISSFIENLIKSQADDQLINARPDQKENIEAVRNHFLESLKTLKKSRLGKGQRGNTALYELPWYIIIGPPATGKSTLLRHSGLSFPLTDKKIQGVGGTRNCDWWFANDGIILDTAGRYTVDNEDKAEWMVFLDVLKKARKKQPINGVIVAISIDDLINGSDDEVERYAERIKARCDELVDKLEVKFPIYLMFTKCDLMDGFVEFFGDLTKNEREQVWGCTLSDEQRSTGDLDEIFQTEIDKIIKSLNNWRLDKLNKERKLEKRERIFLFPMQYSDAKKKIIRFVSCLFQPNPYRENPILRGFYFTCGTQEGSPIDKIIGRVNPAFSAVEKKSYFIKDCFTKVIFPDQHFAQLTEASKRTRKITLMASIFSSVIFAGGLISGISVSYFNNKKLVKQLYTDAVKVTEIGWNSRMDFQDNFTSFDNLRKTLQMLDDYEEENPPLGLRFGLYEGSGFIDNLRNIYLSRLNEIMLIPLKWEMEKGLEVYIKKDSSEDWDSLYNSLKAYLMFSRPDKINEDFLGDIAKQYWMNYLLRVYGNNRREDIGKIADSQISYYLSLLADNKVGENFISKPNQEITRKVRSMLSKEPAAKSIYLKMKKIAESQLSPLRLSDILSPDTRDILTSIYHVPGTFTKFGYDLYVKDYIAKAGMISDSGDWVLESQMQQNIVDKEKQERIVSELKQLYISDYIETWKTFIGSVSIVPFNSINDLVKKLNILSDEGASPFVLLFSKMYENMQIDVDKEDKSKSIVESGSKLIDKIKDKIGLSQTETDARGEKDSPKSLMGKERSNLSRFSGISGTGGDKKSGLENYLQIIKELHETFYSITESGDSVNEIKLFTQRLFSRKTATAGTNELISGVQRTNYIIDDFKSRFREPLKRLLVQVFDQTGAICIKAASEQINNSWEEQVYKIYRRDVQGKFPFLKDAGEEASRRDVADFLMPIDGLLWQFYNKELKFFLTEENNSVRPKKWRTMNVPFTPETLKFLGKAHLIKNSLFWKDKKIPKVKFWFRPHPPKSIGKIEIYISKTVIYLDGQELVYKNGPEVWEPFSWPGRKLEQEGLSPAARLEISRGIFGHKTKKSYEGEWSLFRLLDEAKVKTDNNKFFKLKWSFPYEGETVEVKVDLKTESSQNPFIPGLLSGFTCPEQLTALNN